MRRVRTGAFRITHKSACHCPPLESRAAVGDVGPAARHQVCARNRAAIAPDRRDS